MGLWIPGGLKGEEGGGGGGYVPPDWATGSDEEIIEALEKHYNDEVDLTEYWSVGDKRSVNLPAMTNGGYVGETHGAQTVQFVLSEVGGKTLTTSINGHTECIFQVDQVNSLDEGGYMASSNTSNQWSTCARRRWCNDTYKNAIPSTLREIFKEFVNTTGTGQGSSSGTQTTNDYFALRSEIEVFGSCSYSVSGEGSLITYYNTSNNRKKKSWITGSEAYGAWWLRSPRSGARNAYCQVTMAGNASVTSPSIVNGIAPFGVI